MDQSDEILNFLSINSKMKNILFNLHKEKYKSFEWIDTKLNFLLSLEDIHMKFIL